MQHIKAIAVAMVIIICATSSKKQDITSPVPQSVTQKKVTAGKAFTSRDFRKYSYDAQGQVLRVESQTHSWRFVLCN